MSVQNSTGEIAADDSPPLIGKARRRRPTWPMVVYPIAFAAFFTLCLLVSRTVVVTSDASNNALQGWDMLHGHFLLHGWIIGDATYYGYELPLYAVTEAIFGLNVFAAHVEAAASYTLIAILGAAIAKNRRTGFEGAARVAAVLAVLSASMTVGIESSSGTFAGLYGPVLLLAEPNHTSTCVFLLGTILLLQRKPGWRGTPWAMFALLTIGQVGDVTVRFMFVSAIVVVCIWRAIQVRDWRGRDAVFGLAALLSVPASLLVRKLMLALGSYTMVTPPTQIASPDKWFGQFTETMRELPELFGLVDLNADLQNTTTLKLVEILCMPLGLIALVLAVFGLVRTIYTWLRADHTDQLLVMAVFAYIGGYFVSTVVGPDRLHEFAGVMPVMAVLAARALPTRLAVSKAATPVAVLAALFPLVSGVAARPIPPFPPGVLAAWLEAHNLHYGVAGYWEASSVTLASNNAVQVRAVNDYFGYVAANNWEIQASWYKPSAHYANFVIANDGDAGDWFNTDTGTIEQSLGFPTAVYDVDSYEILVYPFNILSHVHPAIPVPHSN
jgi:hypothetical protein